MAGNINIPQDLTKIVEIKYKDDSLRRFLVDLSSRLLQVETEILDIKQRLDDGGL